MQVSSLPATRNKEEFRDGPLAALARASAALSQITLPVTTSTPSPAMWTTRTDFQKFCKDVMSISFFQDPHARQVVVQHAETESTIAQLTDRLERETDQDFIQITEKKLDTAKLRLQRLQDEFEGSHVGDIFSRCNEYSRSMNGPTLKLAGLVLD